MSAGRGAGGRQKLTRGRKGSRMTLYMTLIHISEPHETVIDLVCRLLLEKKKEKSLHLYNLPSKKKIPSTRPT